MVELAKARQVLQVNDGYGQIFKRGEFQFLHSDSLLQIFGGCFTEVYED